MSIHLSGATFGRYSLNTLTHRSIILNVLYSKNNMLHHWAYWKKTVCFIQIFSILSVSLTCFPVLILYTKVLPKNWFVRFYFFLYDHVCIHLMIGIVCVFYIYIYLPLVQKYLVWVNKRNLINLSKAVSRSHVNIGIARTSLIKY